MSAPVRVLTAAALGSSTTRPAPFTYTRVRAAPRSTAKWQRRNCSRLAVMADPPESADRGGLAGRRPFWHPAVARGRALVGVGRAGPRTPGRRLPWDVG